MGFESYLFPLFKSYEISPLTWQKDLRLALRSLDYLEGVLNHRIPFHLNPEFKTSMWDKSIKNIENSRDLVVIYPEIVFGNPLKGQNVARWILHNPSFHTGKANFSPGEVQFLYGSHFEALKAPFLEIAPFELGVFYINWALFEENSLPTEKRSGSAYIMKKGKNRPLIHDLSDSVCIDNKPLREVAEIFKRVKYVYSYDTATFYSTLGALAGAISIIIPGSKLSPDPQNMKNRNRNGVAWGFNDVERALTSLKSLRTELKNREKETEKSIKMFVDFWHSRLN